MENKW